MNNKFHINLHKRTLKNGLNVIVYEKPTSSKFYALYTTKYGSNDSSFTFEGKKINSPDGVAHFLEHKMFEKKDGDTFNKFAKNGANANAFTSFNQTSYLFSCTSNFYQNLEILVDMVNEPWFSKQSVEKEKGIIEQEIKMYDDNPDWRGYFGTLQNMYQKHPIRVDIAGSTESIYQITKEDLNICYKAFYSPNNMCLTIAGNVKVEQVVTFLENNIALSKRKNVNFKTKMPKEDLKLAKKRTTIKLDTASIKYNYGLKLDDITKDYDATKSGMYLQLYFSHILSSSSKLMDKYVKNQTIEDNFSYYYDHGKDYAYLIFGGNVKNEAKMKQVLNEILTAKISKKQFNIEIKKHIGNIIYSLDSITGVSNAINKSWILGLDNYQEMEKIYELNYDEFNLVIKKYLKKSRLTLNIIKPLKK